MVASCLFFIGSASIALLSQSYMTMTYKIPLVELCGKDPVRLLKPFLLMFNGMVFAHNSCVFTVYFYG